MKVDDGQRRYRRGASRILAFAFLVWAGFVAIGAGFLGALLSCSENTTGCDEPGFPSLVEPWAWDQFDVFPEVFVIALAGLGVAVIFSAFVWRGRRLLSVLALALGRVLLSYPFFAGLTRGGQAWLAFGPLFGLAALATTPRRQGSL